MRIENEILLDYSDVLIRPKRSTLGSRSEVDLVRSFDRICNACIPIIAANMDGVGTFTMAEALAKEGMMTCIHKNYPKHDWRNWCYEKGNIINNNWFYSMGITDADLSKCDALISDPDVKIKNICIDVANGYSQSFLDFVRKMKDNWLDDDQFIMAGNVVTREMTEELILAGVDIVKVGIGPGSVCTTRIQTGVGYPQLSAVIECADAAHGLGAYVCADGGCTTPGDVAKAFGAGADFVMLGGMLAGHYESEIVKEYILLPSIKNDIVSDKIDSGKYIDFYGSSSQEALDKNYGGKKDYRAAEGKSVKIPFRGYVKDTVQEILGGVRSSCTYIGAKRLKDLPKCTTFVRINNGNTHNRIFGEK